MADLEVNTSVVPEKLSQKIKKLRMDGMPNIARSSHVAAKLVWLCLLITSLAFCVWLIVASVNDYLKFEVSTSTRKQHESIISGGTVFPTVTICLINPLTTDYSVTQTLLATAHPIDNSISSVIAMEAYAFNTTGSYMTDEQKKRLSSIEQLLVSCRIGNKLCNSSDFQWVWHPTYFGCFRFNAGFDAGNNRRDLIFADTPSFALSIELYSGLPKYWSDAISYAAQRGFYVSIQNATEFPYNPLSSAHMITSSFSADITVRRSFYSQFNQWPYTYSECRVNEKDDELMGPELEDPYLFEQVKATNFTYSRSTCVIFCAQLYTTQECDCNYYQLPLRVDNYRLCLNYTERTCAADFFRRNFIADAESSFLKDSCEKKCPLECFTSKLSSSLAFFTYPTTADLIRVANDPRMTSLCTNQTDFTVLNYLRINLVKINVHYEDTFGYIVSEEKAAITVDTLVGTLGGHLHLFLGMSLMSFLELGELVMNSIFAFYFFKSKSNKTAKKKRTTQLDTLELTEQNVSVSKMEIKVVSEVVLEDYHASERSVKD